MNLANSHIQKLSAYQPPLENRSDFKGSLLDFNERSCALPQEILKPLTKALEKEGLQIYPHYCEAIQQIAKYCGVDANQVLLCNGSDSGISILFRTFLQPRQCAIIPTPSFPIFMQSANTQNTDVLNIPYQRQDYPKRKFIYPIEEIIKAMQTHKIGLVVVCTPNNPTGTLVTLKDIERILKQGLKTQTLVLLTKPILNFLK